MTKAQTSQKTKWGEVALQHLIVFLICIVFPGLTTAVAPATWLTFERTTERLTCTARTCVYFIVPYKVQRVDQVVSIDHREREGEYHRVRKHGRDTNESVYSDGEGFLQILGENGQKAEVSVSPASLDSVLDKTTAILNTNTPGTRRLFVIANWKFGGLMGGVLTMFTALYVVGYSLELVRRVLKLLRII